MNLNIGDKLYCDNGKVYILGKGNEFYTFSIINELGEIVNFVQDYHIFDCINADDEFPMRLCVGEDSDGELIYVKILEHIPTEGLY